MTELAFPIWIVIWRRGVVALPAEADGIPGYIAAFSTAANAASFIERRGKAGWEIRQVSQSALASLREELRVMVGMYGLCLDPTGADPGTPITFEELDRLGLNGTQGKG